MDHKNHHALGRVFDAGTAVSYDKCQVILHAETVPEYLYFIDRGFVKAYTITEDGARRIIAIQAKDEMLPLESLFSAEPSMTYYETMTAVTVRKLPKAAVEEALRTDAALMAAAFDSTLTVVREYNQRLRNLELQDARHRIVARLLFLWRRFGCIVDKRGYLLRMPVTHQDLADALNITVETANREFSKLVSDKLVEKRRGAVVLIDPRRLEAILSDEAA